MEENNCNLQGSQDMNLHQFQARDKFFRVIRGKISATSRAKAKKIVKSRGLYWPSIWLDGTKPWIALLILGTNSRCSIPVLGLILSSVKQLEYAVNSYVSYYHHERIHQSLGRIIEPIHGTDDNAEIVCIERLGGLLKSYHRLVA